MIIKDVINILEELAPLHYAEDFDNTGLLVGNPNEKLKGIMVTLDTLEAVVDEAIEEKCNLIVSFHPIIFKGLKKLNGSNYVERTVLKAIKNDIAIFAIHTALDNEIQGVNSIMCDKLNLKNKRILIPKKGTIKKLQTYVPTDKANALRQGLFNAGAGELGNYENCSFTTKGTGSYRGNENSEPVIGNKNEYHEEEELLVSITYKSHLEREVLQALREHHPYEEIAYEIYSLDNANQNIGMGMVGDLEEEIDVEMFLQSVKTTFNCGIIRHSTFNKEHIKTIAVLGGSGSFAIGAAKRAKADVFITSDLKYHDFFSAENEIILADIGHYESEQFTKNFLANYLSKKITNFAVVLSQTNTNPISYF